MESTFVVVALALASVGSVVAMAFLVRAMHVQERGAERRHREWMNFQTQIANPERGTPREPLFSEIPDLPEPPSAPISVLTPPRSDDEDENRTEIFLGPVSKRAVAIPPSDGPSSSRTLATG